jgi:hypothetical protein
VLSCVLRCQQCYLILLSEAYKRHDLSSLKLVSYGTEPMPESTLRHFHEILPDFDHAERGKFLDGRM